MSTFEERFGDVSEPLLACRVPNVESEFIVLEFYPFDFEVHSYST